MITVTEAISSAMKTLHELYKDPLDTRLEEVELQANSTWTVTVSFLLPRTDSRPEFVKALVPVPDYERTYKIFSVDADNGMVHAMKIRSV